MGDHAPNAVIEMAAVGTFEADIFFVGLSHVLQNVGLTAAHQIAELLLGW